MVTLKQARKAAGFTQKEAALYFGVNHVTISNWERGATLPTREKLAEICRFYGIAEQELNIWTEPKRQHKETEVVKNDAGDGWGDGPDD